MIPPAILVVGAGVASSRLRNDSLAMSGRPVYEITTLFPNADMAELVDAPDLKSVAHCERAGSIPAVGIFGNERDGIQLVC